MSETSSRLAGFGPYNNRERMAPAFKLSQAGGGGGLVASWDFKQRQPLVLYFLPQPSPSYLGQLQAEYRAYRDINAAMLVIVPEQLAALTVLAVELKLSYPLLADSAGTTYRNYLQLIEYDLTTNERPTALFVADRFGAISRYATATLPEGLPPQSEVLKMLEFLGTICNP